jgi:myosin heavy subunit
LINPQLLCSCIIYNIASEAGDTSDMGADNRYIKFTNFFPLDGCSQDTDTKVVTPKKSKKSTMTTKYNKLSAKTKRAKTNNMMYADKSRNLRSFADTSYEQRAEVSHVSETAAGRIKHLNAECSKLLVFKSKYESLKVQNTKLRNVQKNLTQKEQQNKELQSKYDKCVKNWENIKTKYDSSLAKIKGLEMMVDKETAVKYELKGKLQRADQDCKAQHYITKELNENIRKLEFDQK